MKLILNPTAAEALELYPKGDHSVQYLKGQVKGPEESIITDDDKQEYREKTVLNALNLGVTDPHVLDKLDRAVCEAVGLDPDDKPAHFIFDALYASR